MRILPALALTMAPLAGAAQPTAPGWAEIFNLDALVTRVIQSGLAAARTQVDLTYDDLTVSGAGQLIALSGLEIYPILETDDECRIGVERVTITLPPATAIEDLAVKIDVMGAEMDRTCLPPETRAQVALFQQEVLGLDHVVISMAYHVPSASAEITVHAAAAGNAEVTLAGDLSYLALEDQGGEPYPVIFLEGATLTVQDLGLWEKIRPILPPPFTDAQTMAGMVSQQGGNMIVTLPGEGELALTATEEALVTSAAETIGAFLTGSGRAVLEVAPAAPVYLDIAHYEENPRAIIADLEPILRSAPSAEIERLAPAQIRAVMDGSASAEERVAVGRAFLTGVGAPRNESAARDTLLPVWDALDTSTRLSLLEAMPADAATYGNALLVAAEAGVAAAPLLARLEAALPLSEVLSLQADAFTPAPAPATASAQRSRALAHLSGFSGMPRNYRAAALAATLAVALGDQAAQSILAELETRFGHTPLWQAQMREIADEAVIIWLSEGFLSPEGGQ